MKLPAWIFERIPKEVIKAYYKATDPEYEIGDWDDEWGYVDLYDMELDILIPIYIAWCNEIGNSDYGNYENYIEVADGTKYGYRIGIDDECRSELELILESDIHWYTAN